MKSIRITKFKSSELNTVFSSVQSVEIDDNPFAQGGFGKVYHCNSVNGKTISPQVLKILIDDGTGSAERGIKTIEKLQEKIIFLNTQLKQNNETPIEKINALGALPQFSYEGELEGQRVIGYSADLLPKHSWFEFGDIFSHDDLEKRKKLRNSFYNLPLDHRLKYAFDLAEGFSYLQKMNFIYADLNPKNFFVNEKDAKLCLIDFEGGAVNENPETYGKPGEWLAPEIQEQLLNSNSPLIKVDLNTDTWAVAVGIHFMLFNFHPLFFLKVRGKKEMQAYFKKYKWPEIDKSDNNFRDEYEKTYDWYISKLNSEIPQPLTKAFSDTINNGYSNPNKRLSYKQWLRAIKGLMQPPTILAFQSSNNIIIDGVPIKLSWKTDTNTHTVTLDNGIGNVTDKNEIEVTPTKNTKYILKAVGHFGETEKSIEIRVFPTPIIETVFVPAPKMRETTNLQIEFPKFPNINVSISNFQNGIDLNEQKIQTTLPNFNMSSFERIELIRDNQKANWRNILSPLFSKFATVNKWIFRKNKITQQ